MTSENSSAMFTVTATTARLTSGHFRKTVKLWETKQVQAYSQVFKSVRLVRAKLTIIQHNLVDSKGGHGPYPQGMIRFGLVPESVAAAKEKEHFDDLLCVPHMKTVALSEQSQVTSEYEIPASALRALELDLACAPRRDSRPVFLLGNGGYKSQSGRGEKGSTLHFDLCTGFVEFDIECEGAAFGI